MPLVTFNCLQLPYLVIVLTFLSDFRILTHMHLLFFYLIMSSHSGVIITDNVWVYGDDHTMRSLHTGDVVSIISYEDEMVHIEHDNAPYRVFKDVLIDFETEIAAEKLFVFARGYFDEEEYRKSARLFDAFIEYFSTSVYSAEALYYTGLAYEKIAQTHTETDTFPGLVFREELKQWLYTGNAYTMLLQLLPESSFAPKAQYRLLHIERMKNLPWQDSVVLIEKERTLWLEFAARYNDTDEYVLALLEAAYLNRVLFEITGDGDCKNGALELYQKISSEFPNSLAEAQAKLYIIEIKRGINIYRY